jgi:hypothetical protein
MAGKQLRATTHAPHPLPMLGGRVAVLGGTATDQTTLLIRLALRQIQQHGAVVCLDARRQRQTEVQFRLLVRGNAHYIPLPASGEVPADLTPTVLNRMSRGLQTTTGPSPLLLCDHVREHPDWEHALAFLLNAGVVVVEFLPAAHALVFGRYDTILLLRAEPGVAEAYSRAVGHRVSAADLGGLGPEEGILIHLARVQRVILPS